MCYPAYWNQMTAFGADSRFNNSDSETFFEAGVFYNSSGLTLRPEVSALLMSASSIIVATNVALFKQVEAKLYL